MHCDTAAAHSRKVAQAATKLQRESDKITEQVYKAFDHGKAELTRLVDAQAGLMENEYAADIRAMFRSMTDQERADGPNNALKSGDSNLIAAVGLAPPIVSGVNPGLQIRYLAGIRKQKAPELL